MHHVHVCIERSTPELKTEPRAIHDARFVRQALSLFHLYATGTAEELNTSPTICILSAENPYRGTTTNRPNLK